MSLKKRLRVIWAAMTQDWSEERCKCGASQFVNGERWTEAALCVDCEMKRFDAWMQDFRARNNAKGAA